MMEQDKTILTLSQAGKSQREIGRQLGLSHTAVAKALKRLAAEQEREENLRALWFTGWQWSQARFPVSLAEVRSIGSKLMAAVETLQRRQPKQLPLEEN